MQGGKACSSFCSDQKYGRIYRAGLPVAGGSDLICVLELCRCYVGPGRCRGGNQHSAVYNYSNVDHKPTKA